MTTSPQGNMSGLSFPASTQKRAGARQQLELPHQRGNSSKSSQVSAWQPQRAPIRSWADIVEAYLPAAMLHRESRDTELD
jgi:hypothetical protein